MPLLISYRNALLVPVGQVYDAETVKYRITVATETITSEILECVICVYTALQEVCL
jgi:hypothetical protein